MCDQAIAVVILQTSEDRPGLKGGHRKYWNIKKKVLLIEE